MNKKTKVCLVTEELAGLQGSGGIGAAFSELAFLLAKNDWEVDILYCPVHQMSDDEKKSARNRFFDAGIKINFSNPSDFCWQDGIYESKSYAVYHEIKEKGYDVIHFHDYKGLGFASTSAKRQGLAFKNTTLVIQMHGPTVWTINTNNTLFMHEDQLKIDFMERESVKKADVIVSPSEYLIDYLKDQCGFIFPRDTRVIKNNCFNLFSEIDRFSKGSKTKGLANIDEIIFFGRHEDRKGFALFLNAISLLKDEIEDNNVIITFLGKLGTIAGQPSGVYLAEKAKDWSFNVNIFTSFDRSKAAAYLSENPNSLVVIPSEENSPYTVLETLILNKALVTSSAGGGKELIDVAFHAECLYEHGSAVSLAKIIKVWISGGGRIPQLSEPLEKIEEKWIQLHSDIIESLKNSGSTKKQMRKLPTVTVGITHYERPDKIIDAVVSIIKQTYEYVEIIVIDDGSTSPEALSALERLEVLLKRVGGRLIKQKNSYLGAARNRIVKESKSEFICFLDDDDVAFPQMIEKLVIAAQNTKAQIINCCNIFMDLSRRSEGVADPERFYEKISFVPLGGPISIAPIHNCLGSATALISRDYFHKFGGYTELKGVGYEDYEFFFKALQNGVGIEVVPEPLYLYEVGRPSMISNTSAMVSTRRVIDSIPSNGNTNWAIDLIAMSAGKSAYINSTNRLHWEYKSSKYSELLLPLLEGELSQSESLDKLQKYAEEIGSYCIAEAFERCNSKKVRDNTSSAKLGYRINMARRRKGDSLPDETRNNVLFDVKYLIALDRYEEALKELSSAVEKTGYVDGEVLGAIEYIAATKELKVDYDIAQRLLELVEDSVLVDFDADRAREILCKLVGNSLPYENVVKFAKEVLEEEEKQYIEAYPDLKKAMRDGVLVSPYQHYLAHGISEKRNGFATTKTLNKYIKTNRGE